MMNDSLGRPDVAGMVIKSFQQSLISFVYIGAMAALLLHLMHGIQSSFQTMGLNSERTMTTVTRAGTVTAIVLFLGYIAIPVVILLGIMKG
jgi:succinate dehydrogenase / fumarate reductase cytochrome b subunit